MNSQTPPKIDRRVRRTRRRLRDSLIELIMEHGYDAITIQNITDHADLSRATFYLHYKDKDELLASSLEEMFDELVRSLEKPLISREFMNQDQPTSLIAFQHVKEYANLYRALLLGERGVTYVINRAIQYVARISEKQLELLIEPDQRDLTPVPIPMIAQNTAGALFALIVWWLENDMKETPERMAQMFTRLQSPATLAGLGLTIDNRVTAN